MKNDMAASDPFHDTREDGRFLRGRWVERALALAIVLSVWFSLGAVYERYPRADLLVDAAWVKERLGDPSVRLVDARDPLSYRRGHLPGAVSIGDRDIHTFDAPSGRAVADPVRLEDVIRRAGIGSDTTVVVYGDARSTGMPQRVFWVFEYLGHTRVKILEGGLGAWLAAGGETTRQAPRYAPGNFRARVDARRLAGTQDIRSIQRNGDGHIIDLRPPYLYRGETGGDPRAGHIAGAASLQYEDLYIRPGVPRRAHSLRVALARVEVHPWHKTVVYGETGIEAAPAYFALRLLGNEDVKLYDGSWTAWASDPSLPVETAPGSGGGGSASTTCW